MKKEFLYEHSNSYVMENIIYAIVTLVFVSSLSYLVVKLLGFSDWISLIITLSALIFAGLYVKKIVLGDVRSAIVDTSNGTLSIFGKTLDANQVKRITRLSFTQKWKEFYIFKVSGPFVLSVDTRIFPEAKRLDTLLGKVFPDISLNKIEAKSPFMLVVITGFVLSLIFAIIYMVI